MQDQKQQLFLEGLEEKPEAKQKPLLVVKTQSYHVRKCEYCKKEFVQKRKENRFCSLSCSSLDREKKLHIPAQMRFWPKVKVMDSGCWEWMGSKDKDGYGSFSFEGIGHRKQRAHRIAWIMEMGAIPEGMFVLHHCDNPSCVNLLHLFIGTPMDNVRDMIEKGRDRHPSGEENGQSKLNKEQVLEIRKLISNGELQKDVAERFNVSHQVISDIVKRRRWKHL